MNLVAFYKAILKSLYFMEQYNAAINEIKELVENTSVLTTRVEDIACFDIKEGTDLVPTSDEVDELLDTFYGLSTYPLHWVSALGFSKALDIFMNSHHDSSTLLLQRTGGEEEKFPLHYAQDHSTEKFLIESHPKLQKLENISLSSSW